jgi:hypothetical protein
MSGVRKLARPMINRFFLLEHEKWAYPLCRSNLCFVLGCSSLNSTSELMLPFVALL